MKYYRGNEPEDWPIWMEVIVGVLVGTTGILGFLFIPLFSLGLVTIKAALIISVTLGIAFGLWLVWIRIKER